MVGIAKKMKRDPNGLGRGTGMYYHRGNGYYSKTTKPLDRKISAKTKIKNVNLRGHMGDKYPKRSNAKGFSKRMKGL